jgi:hypothetical protein
MSPKNAGEMAITCTTHIKKIDTEAFKVLQMKEGANHAVT